MTDVQVLHQKAMALAEQAEVAKLRGAAAEHIQQLLRSAFEQESQAAALVVDGIDAEPTRSVLHRSAAALAIDCGELQAAED
jgi:Cu/Ag efflux protein CusF